MGIGETIRDARLRAGLTQYELAERMGTSQPRVAQNENSVSNPTWATLVGIADALGMRLVIEFHPAPRRGRKKVGAL